MPDPLSRYDMLAIRMLDSKTQNCIKIVTSSDIWIATLKVSFRDKDVRMS